MKNNAAAVTAIGRMQQRLHRQELKLAGLKNKLDKNQQADTRLKLRLGGLLYLVGWQHLPEADLERAVKSISQQITESSEQQSLTTAGINYLNLHEAKKTVEAVSENVDEGATRELIHQKITKGAMMIKYDLHNVDRATVLGAILKKADE